jgi:hypothetical protein
MVTSKILKDALKIRELQVSLENISTDDKRDINSYTDKEIRAEAVYVRSLYSEGGTMCREELDGEYGAEEQRKARKAVRDLDKLIAGIAA